MRYETPYAKTLRLRWYRLVEAEKRTVESVCRDFGIPKKTYYKCYRIDILHARRGRYVSRKPDSKLKLTPGIRILVENQKKRTNWGPEKMRLWLKEEHGIIVSKTILYRFFRKRGLIRRPQRRLPWYQPLKQRIVPVGPGDLVEADLKYVTLAGIRHYQFSFCDVYTGIPVALIRTRKTDDDAIAALGEAIRALPFPILCLQTDNGGEWRGDFHELCERTGIRHVFVPKRSPWWNGHVERFHGVIDAEFWHNPDRPWETLPDYLHYYVHERIHLGAYLNGLTPQKKLRQWQCAPSPLAVT